MTWVRIERGIYRQTRRDGTLGSTYYVSVGSGRRRERVAAGSSIVEARRKRKHMLAKRTLGLETGEAHRLRIRDLRPYLDAHYARKRGGERALRGFAQVEAVLGSRRVRDVRYDMLLQYVERRRGECAADSTIRNELTPLRVGLRILRRAGKLFDVPDMPPLQQSRPREGIFDRVTFDRVRAELPKELRPLMLAYYWTGWRKRELLSRQWHNIDRVNKTLRLERGETKNGRPRVFPYRMIPELSDVIAQQRRYTRIWERDLSCSIPWVFHRKGKPIKSYDAAWRAACERAGVDGRVVHDFRRTAVTNLIRAGVPQHIAMQLTGHETDDVFRRYGILSLDDLERATERLVASQTEDVISDVMQDGGAL